MHLVYPFGLYLMKIKKMNKTEEDNNSSNKNNTKIAIKNRAKFYKWNNFN